MLYGTLLYHPEVLLLMCCLITPDSFNTISMRSDRSCNSLSEVRRGISAIPHS